MTPDAATRAWIRNASDERAAADGCRFDEARGRFVVDWIARYCKLYEGDAAGQPLKLLPWAEDVVARLFGWVVWSERWQREVRRFRQASVWCAKKNGKSPLLAALGLYLLCGDGEQGQHVYLCAKDGTQSRKIAGEHAMQMLQQSPELMAECKANKATMRITHLPTKSYLEPLSSSNARTQQSKEGLNGSVLIDETHVVDRDFVRRISRAGISRSEPLQVEVSTAGNDPDGYGKERFDYALNVEQGTFTDQSLFVAIHAAPQDLLDSDLEADPLSYGRMANPALGQIVDPEEYLKDHETSKRSIQGLLDFKMYRLNVWQRGSNPWLRSADWERCRRDYAEEDLAGRECYAGLDLSRTRDLSALVLAFPEGEDEVLLLPYFWLPQERALELEGKVPFREWARQGAITLTEGGVTDFGVIRRRFAELARLFRVLKLAYDPKFAEETTQHMADGLTDAEGKALEEGTGVDRLVFKQDDASFASPTQDFERMVLDDKLHHPGNPVLTWQAGHAHVMVKISKVKRCVKPHRDSHQTVDGIISAIMALALTLVREPAPTCEVW